MRISDWSSDACSSDLAPAHCRIFIRLVRLAQIGQRLVATDVERAEHHRPVAGRLQHIAIEPGLPLAAGKRCRDEELEFGPEKADPFGTRRVESAEVVHEARIDQQGDRKSTRLNSSHSCACRMPTSA